MYYSKGTLKDNFKVGGLSPALLTHVNWSIWFFNTAGYNWELS